MYVDRETMDQIIGSVFEEMLTMSAEFTCEQVLAPGTQRVIASISISGEIDGIVVVEVPMDTAVLIAGTMFASPPEDLLEEEIHDAVGEIVNMLGGNVKGLSIGDSQLSLPCVSCDADSIEMEVPPTGTSCVLVGGQPMKVSWYQPVRGTSSSSC
ncbi:MAG: chemotaxis protein CheX [Planctomycetaceae bacterium]